MCTVICLFALHIFDLTAASPAWDRDYGAALRRAEAARKPVAVFIASGKNGPSAVCEEGALCPEVRRLLDDHYVCVYIDASEPAHQRLVQSFDAGQEPLIVLSTHDQAYEAYRHSGAVSNASLARALQHHASAPAAATLPAVPAFQYQPPICRT